MFESKNPFKPINGVQKTRNAADDDRAPYGAVVACAKMEMYGVLYGDESGRQVKSVFVRMGDAWYAAPNSETWANSLKPVSSKYKKQLEAIVKSQEDMSIPKKDSVDVTE